MIEIQVDQEQLNKVLNTLQSMQDEMPSVVKKAVNTTARQARRKLADKAKETYALKLSGFNQSMTIKNATVGRLEAGIVTKGETLELGKFRAPLKVYSGTNKNRPPFIKAKVLNESSLKALVTSETKAFVTRFKSGHVAIVQRVPGKKMESNEKKTFIKKLLSPSIPKMIGNEEKVYGVIEPEIRELIKENVQKELIKTLRNRQ